MRYPLVIFDLDGTLADSSECVVVTMQAALLAHGLPEVDPAHIRSLIGLSLQTVVDKCCPPGTPLAEIDAAVLTYRALYPGFAKTHERLFDGVVPLLESLGDGGVSCCIATGKSHRGALVSTERLGLAPYMREVHGILPGTPGKPHVALLERVFATCRAAPNQAVMVGDTSYDLVMARRFGLDTCAVSWGVHELGHLRSLSPTHVAESFAELQRTLLS